MSWRDHITSDPSILVGKLVVRGTRVGVDFLLELFANGWTREQVLANYPGVSAEALNAVLAYGRERPGDRPMNLATFRRRAREIFDSIPEELRHGVEYVRVEREAVPHPSMPDVYTLGECATGEYDVGLDQPGAVRSGVHLYYGSFRELARLMVDADLKLAERELALSGLRNSSS